MKKTPITWVADVYLLEKQKSEDGYHVEKGAVQSDWIRSVHHHRLKVRQRVEWCWVVQQPGLSIVDLASIHVLPYARRQVNVPGNGAFIHHRRHQDSPSHQIFCYCEHKLEIKRLNNIEKFLHRYFII